MNEYLDNKDQFKPDKIIAFLITNFIHDKNCKYQFPEKEQKEINEQYDNIKNALNKRFKNKVKYEALELKNQT